MEGIIYKGVGGFYDVMTASGLICCKPRGIFRKRGEKPLAGDKVTLVNEADTWFIDAILPRKNGMVRPSVANVDVLFIVASTTQPVPSFFVIDKLTVAALEQQVQPVVVVTKTDIAGPDALVNAYENSGIPCMALCADDPETWRPLVQMLKGRLSVFCGNSGVGKSTLLNRLDPAPGRQTGEISQKLGRGRHTTREVALFEMAGGLVADTPGFASFDLQQESGILADNLQLYFPEISARIGQCKFSGCAHLKGAGCAVAEAVALGDIAQSRYDSYVALYELAKRAENSY